MPDLQTDDTPLTNWRRWNEPEPLNLYRQESTAALSKFDKKAVKLVREITNSNYRSQYVFNNKAAVLRRNVKKTSRIEALLNIVGETSQAELYSSDAVFGNGLKGLEQGKSMITPAESQAFVNPNKSITGIKYTRSVAVLHDFHHALPIPSALASLETMYIIPSGIEFEVIDIVQETWQCDPLISCAREFKDITVYHLKQIS
jgi:hypothetical protein